MGDKKSFLGLPDFSKISEIGEKVTKFVIWGQEALTAIARNQNDLYKQIQIVKQTQAEILAYLKGETHAGICDGTRDGEGDEIRPGDGGEHGNLNGGAN
jgi:hypothetical protein